VGHRSYFGRVFHFHFPLALPRMGTVDFSSLSPVERIAVTASDEVLIAMHASGDGMPTCAGLVADGPLPLFTLCARHAAVFAETVAHLPSGLDLEDAGAMAPRQLASWSGRKPDCSMRTSVLPLVARHVIRRSKITGSSTNLCHPSAIRKGVRMNARRGNNLKFD